MNLAFSARHYGFSAIIITQQLTSITKPYRVNTQILVTFYDPDKNDMRTFLEESVDGTEEEYRVIILNQLLALTRASATRIKTRDSGLPMLLGTNLFWWKMGLNVAKRESESSQVLVSYAWKKERIIRYRNTKSENTRMPRNVFFY